MCTSANKLIELIKSREEWLEKDKGGKKKKEEKTVKEEDPVKQSGVKGLSLLYIKLPYWKKLSLWHTVDPMHTFNNLATSILEILGGVIDTDDVRKDFEILNVRKDLWMKGEKKPDAPYVFTLLEWVEFCNHLKEIRVPTGFCSTLGSHIATDGSKKLINMKSHDNLIILRDILPSLVRGKLGKGPRQAIINVSSLVKKLSTKLLDPSKFEALAIEVAKTIAYLEFQFPPAAISGIMLHLLYHIVEEIAMAGNIQNRSMFPAERHYMTLKGFVLNRAHPKGSSAKGYVLHEAMEIWKYQNQQGDTTLSKLIGVEDSKEIDFDGQGKKILLDQITLQQVMNFVLENTPELQVWKETEVQ
ncbi:unnamed protein product [Calypogeia fissa]